MKTFDLKAFITERWLANVQVVWLVGSEPAEYQEAIIAATNEMREDQDRPYDVDVWCHDKLTGLTRTRPRLTPPTDGTGQAVVGLQHAIAGTASPGKFNEEFRRVMHRDAIFVFRDIDDEVKKTPVVAQAIRNICHANMCADDYAEQVEEGERGRRMIILVTSDDSMASRVPDLKPQHVPLPSPDALRSAIQSVWLPHTSRYVGDPDNGIEPNTQLGLPPLTPEEMQTLTGALRGFTMQEAEDCCTMVLVSRAGVYRGKGITDMHALLARIEQEKIAQFNAVPGVTYISADSMTTRVLPGYESLFEMIEQGMSISAEVAMKHRVGRMRSMALAGGPGVGKTDVAISIAAAMSKPLIQWSIGESQDRLVGNSEKNARRVLDIAEATGAVVLVDDIDKAGVGNASHGQSGNDSFGRVVQMLLTHSSQKDSDAVFIYTFNRTRNIPQELIRPGRVDFRGYVRRPDEVTRFEILKTHVAFHGVEADNSDLEKIASDEVTDDWTGAELATLVQAATRHALRHDTIRLDGPWMLSQANDFVPMAKMNVWQDDLAQMETDCQQFTKLGRVDRNTHETTVAGATRNYRSAAI